MLQARGRRSLAVAASPFVEKPDAARAAEFLASGRFLWNAGIFLFKASLLFEELARTAPAVLDAARRALAAQRAGDISSFAEIFSSSPSVSIDVAVMEKAKRVLTIPCPCGWSDLGSLGGRLRVSGRRAWPGHRRGRRRVGGRLREPRPRRLAPVRVVGLSGIAVVEAPDGLLVMRLGSSDELRRAVEKGLA